MRSYLFAMLFLCCVPQDNTALNQPISTISQGSYSSWDRSQAGIIVAKNKDIYNKMCKFINENVKKDVRKFMEFDDKFIYITAFAPETDYEPGWQLEINSIERTARDSLLIIIKATATDVKTSVKSSPRQPWAMFKLNKAELNITPHTRFQLSIRMIHTETIIPMEFK